jgi:ComF family protein
MLCITYRLFAPPVLSLCDRACAMKKLAFLQHSLDLLFPTSCTICKRGGYVLCPACMAALPRFTPPICLHCGRPHSGQGPCQHCSWHPLRLSGLRAVGPYVEPLRACIHALKYEGKTRLAEPLGLLMAQAARFYRVAGDLIIPVPLHEERSRERGYNQAQLLAQVCAYQLGIPLHSAILVRTRATPAQAQLSAPARQQNVAHAFACKPSYATGALQGRKIVIIDDVCTTGATLEACAEPIFAAGASAVWGLVLARPL